MMMVSLAQAINKNINIQICIVYLNLIEKCIFVSYPFNDDDDDDNRQSDCLERNSPVWWCQWNHASHHQIQKKKKIHQRSLNCPIPPKYVPMETVLSVSHLKIVNSNEVANSFGNVFFSIMWHVKQWDEWTKKNEKKRRHIKITAICNWGNQNVIETVRKLKML